MYSIVAYFAEHTYIYVHFYVFLVTINTTNTNIFVCNWKLYWNMVRSAQVIPNCVSLMRYIFANQLNSAWSVARQIYKRFIYSWNLKTYSSVKLKIVIAPIINTAANIIWHWFLHMHAAPALFIHWITKITIRYTRCSNSYFPFKKKQNIDFFFLLWQWIGSSDARRKPKHSIDDDFTLRLL